MDKIMQLYRDNAGLAPRPFNLVRDAAEVSLYMYAVIGGEEGVTALQVADLVSQIGDAEVLHVYINSPGGDVFESRAIMAALARFPGKKIAHIDSLCASAATSIAMACNEVEMADGAFFMIHNAMGIAFGDKNALRERADLMEKIEGSIVGDYTAKTGVAPEQVAAWMNEETWFSAAEALEHGFVDRVTAAPAAAGAAWNLASYGRPPAILRNVAPSALLVSPPSMTQANANRLTLLQVM
jgi:ATP-dependent Clp protease protease subunit